MKDTNFTQWYLIAALIALIVMSAIASKSKPHSCRWPMCPYKGITQDQHKAKVFEQTGYNIDAFRLGMLHLKYPDYEYDQLEEKLPK